MKARNLVAALVAAGAVGMVGTACAQQQDTGQGAGQGASSAEQGQSASGQSGQLGQGQSGQGQSAQSAQSGQLGQAGQPGGAITAMASGTATVKSVDKENRTVTLQRADGSTATIKCGPQMENFDQIKEGDKVRATIIDRMAVSVGQPGSPQVQQGQAGVVALPAAGQRPGIILADTAVKQFKVTDIDQSARTVTLEDKEMQGAKPETIKVGKNVDLSNVKKGDEVTVRLTQGLALMDEKGAGAAGAAGEAQPAGAQIRPGEGVEGLDVTTRTATVESVDKDKREVTLKGQNGQERTIHLGKEVRNFDQIQPGDKVTATLADEVAVAVTKGGGAPDEGQGVMMARSPQGAMPGMLIAATTVERGKVDSVDAEKRTITMTGPEGKQRTLKAGQGVDLSQLKAGDDVSARVTQALGIIVQKPQQGG